MRTLVGTVPPMLTSRKMRGVDCSHSGTCAIIAACTTWVIVSQRVVDKDARALFRTSDTTLTLTTCWPIRYLGSAPSRLIVTAKPVKHSATRIASTN